MVQKRIIADEVTKEVLCEKFSCTKDTVNKALSFRRDGSKSRSIRTYAVNFLGCYLEDNVSKYL